MEALVAVRCFAINAPDEELRVPKPLIHWLQGSDNNRRQGAPVVTGFPVLSSGPLVKTPGLTAFWTQVMLWVVIGADGI